jgi:hypothetical protein
MGHMLLANVFLAHLIFNFFFVSSQYSEARVFHIITQILVFWNLG